MLLCPEGSKDHNDPFPELSSVLQVATENCVPSIPFSDDDLTELPKSSGAMYVQAYVGDLEVTPSTEYTQGQLAYFNANMIDQQHWPSLNDYVLSQEEGETEWEKLCVVNETKLLGSIPEDVKNGNVIDFVLLCNSTMKTVEGSVWVDKLNSEPCHIELGHCNTFLMD